MRRIVWGIALTCLVTAQFAFANEGDSDLWSDSGITRPKYAKLLQNVRAVALKFPKLVEELSYDETPEGRPLRMFIVGKKITSRAARPALLITGATHGNEYLNIEDRLPEAFLNASKDSTSAFAKYLDAGGVFVFVPIVNPDGYDSGDRYNSKGRDLNRDYSVKAAKFDGFEQPETKLLTNKVEALTKAPYNFRWQVTVDYHCCAGAVLYPWSFTRDPMPAEALARHKLFASYAQKLIDIDAGISDDVIGYSSVGTSKDYFYEKYGAVAFTYEGRYRTERNRFNDHVKWFAKMIEQVTNRTLR